MDKLTPYLKAIVGALIAGLGSLYQAADAGGVSAQEWIATAIATLTALGVVWGIPNIDPKGKHQDESVQPPERGEIGVLEAMMFLALLIVIFVALGVIR